MLKISRSLLSLLCLLLLTSSVWSQVPPEAEKPEGSGSKSEKAAFPGAKKLESSLKDLMERRHVAGLAATIVKDQKILWNGAFGWADVAAKRPITSDTLFQLAAVSKTVTVCAILQQVEQGLIDLDTDIKVNVEVNHATLAGHDFHHEIATAISYDLLGSVDANTGDDRLGWDTDQFPNSAERLVLPIYEILRSGGIAPGGFNFDAHLRRQSTDRSDLFRAHIAAMDTLARATIAAQAMIEEVRRQFREIDGLLEGREGVKPDSARCIEISTQAALREMVAPGLTAIAAPVIVGTVLGAAALGGLLAGALVTGVLMALFMANAGGAWDNAKKAIEQGHIEGAAKGDASHDAAIIGDTIGDPFKDTSGPSLNILIKLMSIVAVVIAPGLSLTGML